MRARRCSVSLVLASAASACQSDLGRALTEKQPVFDEERPSVEPAASGPGPSSRDAGNTTVQPSPSSDTEPPVRDAGPPTVQPNPSASHDTGAPCTTGGESSSPDSTECDGAGCQPGEFVAGNGADVTDATCHACDDGTFSRTTNATECTPWTRCAPGSFVQTPGTTSHDAVCRGCSSGTFSTSTDQPTCTPWTECKPGEFIAQPGSRTEDQVCEACPDGEVSTEVNAGGCVEEGECPAGSVEVTPATADSNAECAPCAAGEYCAGGASARTPCSDGTWDHDENPATPCRAHTECLSGSRVVTDGDAVTDRSCVDCSEGTFTSDDNQGECRSWRQCGPGTYEEDSGSTTTDVTCTECAPGTFSDRAHNANCTPWTVCQAGEYETVPGTTSSDRVCTMCPEDGAIVDAGACTNDQEILAFQMTDGEVVMEAEHYHLTSSNGSADSFTELVIQGISGDTCLELGPDDASSWTTDVPTTAPRLDYYVHFTTTGTFTIHVRGDAGALSTGLSDSCHAGVDDVLTSTHFDFDNNGDVWGWISQPIDVDTTGVHVVTVWGREDGFRVDKIVVNLETEAPVGNGPDESPRAPTSLP